MKRWPCGIRSGPIIIEHFQAENLLTCRTRRLCAPFLAGAWFTPDGKAIETSGFDGILGNPPWEGFKPFRKEFAASFYRGKPQFSKMGMDGPTFNKWFDQELKTKCGFCRTLART